MHPHKNAAPLGGPSSGMAQKSPRKDAESLTDTTPLPNRPKPASLPGSDLDGLNFSSPDGEVVHLALPQAQEINVFS